MRRNANDKERADNTGEWLPANDDYLCWLNEGGIIWLRGKAGSGKSMLMDYAIDYHKSLMPDHVHFSFAFNKRFGGLKSSAVGMFRALLHQLLTSKLADVSELVEETRFKEKCKNQGTPGKDWEWELMDVQNPLRSRLKKILENKAVVIYLDALDEVADEFGQDVVAFFRELCDDPASNLFICFSSKSDPLLDRDQHFNVDVESTNGPDAEALIRRELAPLEQTVDRDTLEQVKKELTEKFGGVLLWLAWMIPRVTASLRDGRPFDIRRLVRGYPVVLERIYRDNLDNIELHHSRFAFAALKWTCMPFEGLSVRQLQTAVCIDSRSETANEKLEESEFWRGDEESFKSEVSSATSILIRGISVADEDGVEESPIHVKYATMHRCRSSWCKSE